MAKAPRENRVPIMMSEEEQAAIDDWRFANRIATRSDAIRRLCQMGLAVWEQKQTVDEAASESVQLTLRLAQWMKRVAAGEEVTEDDDDALGISLQMMELVLKAGLAMSTIQDARVTWADERDLATVRALAKVVRETRAAAREASSK